MGIAIETVYRFRVDLAPATTVDQMNAFYRRAAAKEREEQFAGVYGTYTGHGPCWTAYYVCECGNAETLANFARHVETIARQLKIELEY